MLLSVQQGERMRKNFAAVAVSSCGRQTLCFIEPEGNDVIVHNVLNVDGIGQIDFSFKVKNATDEQEEDCFGMIATYGQRNADALVSEVEKQLGDIDLSEIV
jgi:hypothetical protein